MTLGYLQSVWSAEMEINFVRHREKYSIFITKHNELIPLKMVLEFPRKHSEVQILKQVKICSCVWGRSHKCKQESGVTADAVLTLAAGGSEWSASVSRCFIQEKEPLCPEKKTRWSPVPIWYVWRRSQLCPCQESNPYIKLFHLVPYLLKRLAYFGSLKQVVQIVTTLISSVKQKK